MNRGVRRRIDILIDYWRPFLTTPQSLIDRAKVVVGEWEELPTGYALTDVLAGSCSHYEEHLIDCTQRSSGLTTSSSWQNS
jgi:hypothetical protein